MTDQPADYLQPTEHDQTCVWDDRLIPAGGWGELIVSHGEKQWWGCQQCAAEARTPRQWEVADGAA